jgi:hypothetical protein
MNVTYTPGAIKKFRRTPWRFQQTVERPPANELERFVSTIIAVHGQMEEATVTIDQIVLYTERMRALCPAGSPLPLVRESSLSAAREEIATLLVAAFRTGRVSFLFRAPSRSLFMLTMTIGSLSTQIRSRTSTR